MKSGSKARGGLRRALGGGAELPLGLVEQQGRRPAGEEQGPLGRGMPPPPRKWQPAPVGHWGAMRGMVSTRAPGLCFRFGLTLVAWKSGMAVPGFSKVDPSKQLGCG